MSTSTRPPHLNVTEALPRLLAGSPCGPFLFRMWWPDRCPGSSSRGLAAALRRLASRMLINHYGYATTLRPRALSLASDYTSWSSLTDRTYTGRHLPPADPEWTRRCRPRPRS